MIIFNKYINNWRSIKSFIFLCIIEDYKLADSKVSNRSESISDDDDDIGANEKQLDLVQDQDVNEDDIHFLDLSYYKR